LRRNRGGGIIVLRLPAAVPQLRRFGGSTRMGYSIIVLVASIALVAYFIFATEASFMSKAVVAGLLGFSFACIYWIQGWSLVGLFLLVALSVFIVLYRAWQQAHPPGK
jgi:hypothetical protein